MCMCTCTMYAGICVCGLFSTNYISNGPSIAYGKPVFRCVCTLKCDNPRPAYMNLPLSYIERGGRGYYVGKKVLLNHRLSKRNGIGNA